MLCGGGIQPLFSLPRATTDSIQPPPHFIMKCSQEQKFKIKATRLAATARRQSQQICSCEIKIDKSKLSRHQLWFLNQIFVEAKWYYNHIIGFLKQDHTIDEFKKFIYIKEVNGLDKDKNQILRKLSLPSMIKNGLYQNVMTSLKSLSAKNKKKQNIGDLKFKTEINSILLNNQAFKTKDNQIKIAGLKSYIICNGTEQIPVNVEFGSANLIRRCGNYFINITYYMSKQAITLNGKCVGLDFGIKNTVTTSNGDIFNIKVPLPKKIKIHHKLLSRKIYGSHNYKKAKIKIGRDYNHYQNQKRYLMNQVFHALRQYSWIAIQDDCVQGWKRLWGKKVSESCIGLLMAKIKKLPQTHMVNKWFPSTQLCPRCGCLNQLNLNERVYKCDCGFEMDRDIKSAGIILLEALSNIPMIDREFKPVEEPTTTGTARESWQVGPVKQEALSITG
jgi:transposase